MGSAGEPSREVRQEKASLPAGSSRLGAARGPAPRFEPHAPPAPAFLRMQATVGNRAVRSLLAGPHRPPSPHPVAQRLVIQQVSLPDLTADLDTTNPDVAKTLIDAVYNRGKRKTLAELYSRITAADKVENTASNKLLLQYLNGKLHATSGSVPENSQSGLGEKAALSMKYWSQSASNDQVGAGLRMWVSGDPDRGINWNMIGKHLRGRLTAPDYRLIGTMHYLKEDQQNHTQFERDPACDDPARIQAGRQLLDDARGDIRGALDALPDHDGLSYRQSGVANGNVYGGLVNVEDYIQDTTFWSTSALRISGSAGTWGEDGTKESPKVYFIITGTSGKYIAKYSGQEQGQHEVLFKDRVTFQVTKIANLRYETFFVHVTEVDPATIPPGTTAKNPYTGL